MTRYTQTLGVLFADISDSTGIYRKLGDTAARQALGEALSALAAALPEHKGRLVKTIGDEVLCVFPSADETVLAAIEMQTRIRSMKPGGTSLAVHIGMHYGPVLVDGDDVFGDTVNVAAYLTATAQADQILTTEATEQSLSAHLKPSVRAVFNTILKGSTRESAVYQVLWRKDNFELTSINLKTKKIIPADQGSLILAIGGWRESIDAWQPKLLVGRGEECDLVVNDEFASRRHMTVRLERTHFYLFDHSINGTYVAPDGRDEIHVLRGEILLEGSGRIGLGRSCSDPGAETISFTRDRRAIYRV